MACTRFIDVMVPPAVAAARVRAARVRAVVAPFPPPAVGDWKALISDLSLSASATSTWSRTGSAARMP